MLKQEHEALARASTIAPAGVTAEDLLEARRTDYQQQQEELLRKGKIDGPEFRHRLTSFDNDPEILKSVEKELAERNAAATRAKSEAEHAGESPAAEMTDSRAIRMQRLREIEETVQREQAERESQGQDRSHDGGGRSR